MSMNHEPEETRGFGRDTEIVPDALERPGDDNNGSHRICLNAVRPFLFGSVKDVRRSILVPMGTRVACFLKKTAGVRFSLPAFLNR